MNYRIFNSKYVTQQNIQFSNLTLSIGLFNQEGLPRRQSPSGRVLPKSSRRRMEMRREIRGRGRPYLLAVPSISVRLAVEVDEAATRCSRLWGRCRRGNGAAGGRRASRQPGGARRGRCSGREAAGRRSVRQKSCSVVSGTRQIG